MTVPTFPTLQGVTYPALKTPIWDTDVNVSISGKRTGYARRAYPQYAYELPYSGLFSDAQADFQTLLAFFNTCNGRANLFQFADPDDNAVTAASFGNGDGSAVAFQLTRPITGVGVSWVDPVWAPTGTPQIYVGGALKATPADYSIGSTGLVTFTSAPPAGGSGALTWTGGFNWLCRFDEDSNTFEKFMFNLWELKRIKFSTELF